MNTLREFILSLFFILLGVLSVYEFFSYINTERREVFLYTLSFFLIFTPYVLLGTTRSVKFLKEKYSTNNSVYFGFILYLFLSYLLSNYRFFNLKLAVLLLIYFFVPYLILRYVRKKEEKFDFYVLLTLFIVAIPIDLQLLPKDYGFLKLVIVNIVFFLFIVVSDIRDIGYTWNITIRDLAFSIIGYVVSVVLALPIALYTDFVSFHPVEISFERLLVSIMVIFFFVAIPEEFFFRGLIQNLIEKSLREKTKYAPLLAILITSILFGFSHFYKYDWRYVFLAILGGIVTGTIYYRTKKITVSAITHLLVDATWSLLFVTHWRS